MRDGTLVLPCQVMSYVVRINPEVFEDPKFEVPNYKTKKTKRVDAGFRSHSGLLIDRDVLTATLGHELGHALNEDHILALEGDAQCNVNPNLDRCWMKIKLARPESGNRLATAADHGNAYFIE
jgi:hypothetical protein